MTPLSPTTSRGPGLTRALRWIPGGIRSGGAKRARWGIVDQGLSSVTNFATTALVGHQVAPPEFGAFSVALVVYICVLWAARSVVGEPYAVRMTAASPSDQARAARAAAGAALIVGSITGAVVALLSLLLGSTLGRVLFAMALFLPALLVQDAYRYILITTGRARDAALNDALWLATQVIVVIGLMLQGHPGAVRITIAFGSGALVAAIFGAWQSGAPPAAKAWIRWLLAQRDLGIPFLAELFIVSAAPQLSMLGVAALGGVVAVGDLRAAVFLCSPPTVLFSGLVLVAVPEAVRLRRQSAHRLHTLVVSLAALMTVTTAIWVGALALVPPGVGRSLLKSNWAHGRHVLASVGAFTAASACMLAALVGLRALEATRRSLRIRAWAGPAAFALCLVGTQVAGSQGAALGLAASAVLGAVLSWTAFERAIRGEREGAHAAQELVTTTTLGPEGPPSELDQHE